MVAAAVDGGVRLFVHLPVFEFQLAFSVYRVHNIPRAAVNGSIAVLQSDIPDFLAVSTDHQTFMEVAGRDLDQCILPAKTVCPINRAVSKNGAKKSCTAAIFLEDARAVADVCVSSARQWTGQAAVYLGHRRWVFSSPADTSIVLSCPNRKSETVRLPAVGVFEIPMGCTAQSEEWYFQASFRKDLQRQWVSGGVPSLRQIPSLEFADAAIGQVRLNTEELSEDVRGQLQQVLQRNGQLRGASTKMVHQMRDLSADDHARVIMDNQKISARYPWELLVVIGATIICGGGFVLRRSRGKDRAVCRLAVRVAELEHRLTLHEKEIDDELSV